MTTAPLPPAPGSRPPAEVVHRSWLALAALLLLAGCASADRQGSAADAWASHDREWSARCPGRSVSGVCLGGGGP